MKTVAVFFGGKSNEREISIITGVYAVNLLRSAEEFRVLPVYLTEKNEMILQEKLRGIQDYRVREKNKSVPVFLVRGGLAHINRPKKWISIDCALNCCHGGLGEGGALSALLEWFEIPSASPNMCESALFLDKILSKVALTGLGVPVVPYFALREETWRTDRESVVEEIEGLGYPLIVKPSKLGSSIGISVAANQAELSKAVDFSLRLDDSVLIEKYLTGKRDLNRAVYRFGQELILSPVEEVFSGQPILTFGEKYEGNSSRASKMPAEIPPEIAQKTEEYLRKIYETFQSRGVMRADFLLCGEELYLNELNTVPGTLAAYLFGNSLLQARELLKKLVDEALNRHKPPKEILISGILERNHYGGKSAKGE